MPILINVDGFRKIINKMTVGLYIPNVGFSFRRRRNPIHISIRFLLRRNDKSTQFLYCICISGVNKPTVIKNYSKNSVLILIIASNHYGKDKRYKKSKNDHRRNQQC